MMVLIGKEFEAHKGEIMAWCHTQNQDVFAWSYEDIQVIDPQIACHGLNLNPSTTLMKQKKHSNSTARAIIVRTFFFPSLSDLSHGEALCSPG